jgi:hypothetical protein
MISIAVSSHWLGEALNQVAKRSGGIVQTPLTPSLSPSDGERVAEGRVRGLSANTPIIIGNWYYTRSSPRHLSVLCGFASRCLCVNSGF